MMIKYVYIYTALRGVINISRERLQSEPGINPGSLALLIL